VTVTIAEPFPRVRYRQDLLRPWDAACPAAGTDEATNYRPPRRFHGLPGFAAPATGAVTARSRAGLSTTRSQREKARGLDPGSPLVTSNLSTWSVSAFVDALLSCQLADVSVCAPR
jgi:hypothetical protein